MQLTTILAVLFSSLVLFALVGYTDSSLVRDRRPLSHSGPLIKPGSQFDPRHANPFTGGRRTFVGRAILESIKQRRRH